MKLRSGVCAIALCLTLTASPSKAFATCEAPGLAQLGKIAMAAAQKAAVEMITDAIHEVFKQARQAVTDMILSVQDTQAESIADSMEWYWDNWYTAMLDQTAQLHASVINQTMQIEQTKDASNIAAAELLIQQQKLDGVKLYQPTQQGCQFDTAARYIGPSESVSKAIAQGYALDFNKLGNNHKDTPAATGGASMQKVRWAIYQAKFCDKKNNNGAAGCSTTPSTANMHVLPGKVLFAKPTVDMAEIDTRDAVNELLQNVTGFEVPEPIPPEALDSTMGLEQRQENREYLAQMDAVGALAYSVVGSRTPGIAAPEIKAMREKAGIDNPSSNPSEREIRQALMEQITDPNYFKDLHDSPTTIGQKELYLKAYNLQLLYKLIERQEKISNVYAIETANMLDKLDDSRHEVIESRPLRE